jgi:hypothetical protein
MHIGYARVSTRDQNLALQLDALTKAGCETIFQEQASGATKARPELDRLLASLRPGDTVTIYKLDRLGRSLKHLLDMVAELEFRGVGLVSLTDAINTTSAQGRLVFNLFASLAEFERELIRERTHAGLASAGAGLVVASGASPQRQNVRPSSPRRSIGSSNSASMRLPSACTFPKSRSISTCATVTSSSMPIVNLELIKPPSSCLIARCPNKPFSLALDQGTS